MVFFVLTRAGYDDLIRCFPSPAFPIWLNGGVISADELASLRERGVDVTNFTSPIDMNDEGDISDALSVIAEHHSGQTIWVQQL